MKDSILDYLWQFIDPALAAIGLGKTEFVSLVVIVLTVLAHFGVLPDPVNYFIMNALNDWVGATVATLGLTLRHAIRKGLYV